MTNRWVRISFTASADTVTYSFTSGALGTPASYRWAATIRDASSSLVDRTDWVETKLGSIIVPRTSYEEPIPDLDPYELRMPDLP